MLDDYRKFFSRILCINVSFVSSDYDISRVYIMKNSSTPWTETISLKLLTENQSFEHLKMMKPASIINFGT